MRVRSVQGDFSTSQLLFSARQLVKKNVGHNEQTIGTYAEVPDHERTAQRDEDE